MEIKRNTYYIPLIGVFTFSNMGFIFFEDPIYKIVFIAIALITYWYAINDLKSTLKKYRIEKVSKCFKKRSCLYFTNNKKRRC